MEISRGFYDFGVPYINDNKIMTNIIKELIELGYKTIAIEQVYDHVKKDYSKKQSDLFPAPVELESLKEFKDKIKILNRLTIIYSDVAISHAMTNSANLKRYHLIAGLPKNEAALTHCCTNFNGDIISFDSDESKNLISRKTYQVAVKRGMFFEIKYAPAITNSSHRKDMIKVAHNYYAKGKSKNIIFTSGATNEFEVRGPYDVANLALIFGLTEEQGKSSISSTCRSLYLKAESRRLGKTIMFVKNLGPMVLSSSDDSESENSSENEDSDVEKIQQESKDNDDDDDDMIEEQPCNKKKRIK